MSRIESELDDSTLDRLAELVAERLDGHGQPEPWIGVPEAAAHLACAKQRIYDLVHAGRIPHHRDGSRLLFRRSELDERLEDGA